MEDFDESMGVNDRSALAKATKIMQKRINTQLMKDGVTLVDPETAYIDTDVQIGQDTVIEGNVVIKGRTTIGADCLIGAGSRIEDSTLHDDVTIMSSTLERSEVHSGADVGPNSPVSYTHLDVYKRQVLDDVLAPYGNVTVLNQDVLKANLADLVQTAFKDPTKPCLLYTS